MRRRLLELLGCPVCRASLDLTVFRETGRPVAVPPRPACSDHLGDARQSGTLDPYMGLGI
jgi:uncharacterized protein YbaR (Trm112 family)